jgi:hypothetical protein
VKRHSNSLLRSWPPAPALPIQALCPGASDLASAFLFADDMLEAHNGDVPNEARVPGSKTGRFAYLRFLRNEAHGEEHVTLVHPLVCESMTLWPSRICMSLPVGGYVWTGGACRRLRGSRSSVSKHGSVLLRSSPLATAQ